MITPDTHETPETHGEKIILWLARKIRTKYKKGQQENQTKLWMVPGVLSSLEEEVLDLNCYHKTAKDQIRQMAKDGRTAKEAFQFLYQEEP